MTIICGYDFSASSDQAASAALAIAARRDEPLYLVHSVPGWREQIDTQERADLLSSTRRALDERAQPLRGKGAMVSVQLELESASSGIIQMAEAESASLIVVGGHRHGSSGTIAGATAKRLVRHARVPTLIVRSAQPFLDWAEGRPLRVVIGLDASSASDDAWRWLRQLSEVAPIQVTGLHLYWPPDEARRLGNPGGTATLDSYPEIERVILRELTQRFVPDRGMMCRLKVEPSIGNPGNALLACAEGEAADLLVVGSHQRSGLDALRQGSVSRVALQGARCAMACVPWRPRHRLQRAEPRAVLVATDFSPFGDSAIPYAYGQVGVDGKVYLLHVLPREPSASDDIFDVPASDSRTEAEARLHAAIPTLSGDAHPVTRVLTVQSSDPALAIAQAAEKLGVDMICIATRGRGGLSRALLGSVSEKLLTHTHRPVLLVHALRSS